MLVGLKAHGNQAVKVGVFQEEKYSRIFQHS